MSEAVFQIELRDNIVQNVLLIERMPITSLLRNPKVHYHVDLYVDTNVSKNILPPSSELNAKVTAG